MGAISDLQVARVRELVTERGSAVRVRRASPTSPHSMHGADPQLYVDTLVGWASTLAEVVTAPGKLDVHAHYLPEPYRQALERAGHAQPDGMPAIPAWSAGEHVAADGPPRHRDVAAVGLDPGVHLADGAATERPGPRGERGRPAGGRRPPRSLRAARLAARCPTSTRRSPRSPTAATSSTSTGSSCSPTSAAPTSVIRRGSPCSTSSTGAAPASHPPDVAGLLGAHVLRPAPADARVPLRHHPGRREPGAQRHGRPPSRTSG